MNTDIRAFLIESNGIEGITREPARLLSEISLARFFLEKVDAIDVDVMKELATTFEPDAKLRNQPGMDVRVGDYHPPEGGLYVREALADILRYGIKFTPRQIHQDYEKLLPFTDCNGRTGRLLWLWRMEKFHGGAPRGFLYHFYMQTLSEGR